VSTFQTVVLALVQGITEFLPISSSAHLILVSRWMGWVDQGLSFDMAVHSGSLVAIIVYLRHDLARMARAFRPGIAPEQRQTRRLGLQVLLATVPVAIAGGLLQEQIARFAREPVLIAVCSIVFGVLLWVADRFGSRRLALDDLGWAGVVLIGVAQAVALAPGTSRSGVVMTAGLALGLGRTVSARFSFLLAVPVMSLVAGKDVWDLVAGHGAVTAPGWSTLLLGFVVSALAAYVAAGALLSWLRRQGMEIFALYRVGLGLAVLLPVLL
jgi:undecaprenyl-diphosphatase